MKQWPALIRASMGQTILTTSDLWWRAVVVALWVERLLPTLEIRGSNPDICKILSTNCTVEEMKKRKKKRGWECPIFYKNLSNGQECVSSQQLDDGKNIETSSVRLGIVLSKPRCSKIWQIKVSTKLIRALQRFYIKAFRRWRLLILENRMLSVLFE